MPLRTSDIVDGDIVDAYELHADGSGAFNYKSGVTVVSTTASTKRVVISGYSLRDPDDPTEADDILVITGSPAAGTYTIDEVIDDTTCSVNEVIVDSTGGLADFRHPPGSSKVGLDKTGLEHVVHNTVQEAIQDLDAAILGGSVAFNRQVLETDGKLVYVGDGDIVLRSV